MSLTAAATLRVVRYEGADSQPLDTAKVLNMRVPSAEVRSLTSGG